MIRSGNSPITESFKANDLKKGEWVVVNIEPRLSGFARLVPVKVSVVGSPTFRGWAYNEREHEYSTGSVLYLAKSEDDAQKFIDSNKGKTVKQLKESVDLNESTYDGDTVNWNKISAGDVVGWTIEGMGRLPKVGDNFRVGPFIGKCTKVSGSKVYMKIESDARELDENLNEAVYYVSGSTPTGRGDANSTSSSKITDPARAIEKWFDVGAKHRTGTAITAMKRSDAIALVTWASEHKDKIEEWYEEYGCPYKLDYLLKAIDNQVKRKCMTFSESEFGDMVHPFDVG